MDKSDIISEPPICPIPIGMATSIPIIYTSADIIESSPRAAILPITISIRLTGVSKRLARVPLSFSPAIASTPRLIAPAKIIMVIK